MTVWQVKTLFSVLFYSEVSDFDWAIKIFLCVTRVHTVGCKHQSIQTRHGHLSPQDSSFGSHTTITDHFYSACSWKHVDPTKLYFSKSSGVSMLLLYPLKPGICQCFPTKAYWKYSNVNTSSSSEPLATYPNQDFFFGGGSDICLKVGELVETFSFSGLETPISFESEKFFEGALWIINLQLLWLPCLLYST